MSAFQDWRIKERVARLVRAYQRAGRLVDPFDYSFEIDFGQVNGGVTTGPFVLSVPAEAEYVWLGSTLWPHFEQGNNGGSVERPERFFLKITMRKTGATLGRHIRAAGDLDANWIPIGNMAGSGRLPYFWPFPLVLAGSEQLVFVASNQANTASTIRLTLIGVQLFPRKAA